MLKIKEYPNNADAIILVAIDDFHPEGNNVSELDFTGSAQSSNRNIIEDLLKKFPEAKLTLFLTPNWRDGGESPRGLFLPFKIFKRWRKIYIENQFNITKSEFSEWRNWIISLQNRGCEIALHGYEHIAKNKNYYPSQEFSGQNSSMTMQKIKQGIALFREAGFGFPKSFRPPGWGTNNYIQGVLKDLNFMVHASGSDYKSYTNRALNIDNDSNEIIANCHIEDIERAVKIINRRGVVCVQSHLISTTLFLRSLSTKFISSFQKLRDEIKLQTGAKIHYMTFYEFMYFRKSLKDIKLTLKGNNALNIENIGNSNINKLTILWDNIPYIVDISAKSKLTILRESVNPLVTCVLTVYNGSKNVMNCLNSITNQSLTNFKLIIVNDGSTDASEKLIEEYIALSGDKRISLFNQENLGRSKARNRGLAEAKTLYVTFMEDDAVYSYNYLESLLSCYTATSKSKKVGSLIGPHYVLNRNTNLLTRCKDIERRINFHNYGPESGWFFNTEEFKKIGGYPENLEMAEDVVPCYNLRKDGFAMVYCKEALWLHLEPSNIFNVIRRKFYGGISLSELEMLGYKRYNLKIISILLFTLVLLTIYSIVIGLFEYWLIFLLATSLALNSREILKARKLTIEPLVIIAIYSYMRFFWWFFTYVGMIYGRSINMDKKVTLLKGRL